VALYRSARSGLARALAAKRDWSKHSASIGAFGLTAKVFPDRDDLSTGIDRPHDVGIDGQYQFESGAHTVTAAASWMRDRQRLDATFAAGGADNRVLSLYSQRADVHYAYQPRYGATLGAFATNGDRDGLRDDTGDMVTGSVAGKPDSRGWAIEFNYLPLPYADFDLRYTGYTRFDGGESNYDGLGRNARDNDTTYLYAWVQF